MAIELVACPKCGGCGYLGVRAIIDGPFVAKRNCEGCDAQGYVPVEVPTQADEDLLDWIENNRPGDPRDYWDAELAG